MEYVEALNAHDIGRFHAVIDRTRVAFSDCQDVTFTSIPRGLKVPLLELGPIETYRQYVRAWVDDGLGWRRMYFRYSEERFLVSEPIRDELGDARVSVYDGIPLRFWSIDDDIVPLVGAVLSDVRKYVVEHAKVPPRSSFSVQIDPLSDPRGGPACFVAGSASPPVALSTTEILLNEVRLSENRVAISTDTYSTLLHEGLHWVQFDYSLGAIQKMDWWLVEGWPYHLANRETSYERAAAFCHAPPQIASRLRSGPLVSRAGPEEALQDYILAASLIQYLDVFIDEDAYWRLVDAFRASPDGAAAYRSAIGMDRDELLAGWSAWMKKVYC